jgi:predicted acyltransferase
VLGSVSRFFKLDAVDSQAVDSVLSYTENQSEQGGSEFESARATNPAQYPLATVTVLFRPWVWEAGNSQAFGAAAEGLVLMVVCATSWRRLVRLPRFFWRMPYVVYCVAFTALFIFAFSSISNFGILTRQRTQVFPFFLVLLAIPAPPDRDELAEDADRPRVRVQAPVG